MKPSIRARRKPTALLGALAALCAAGAAQAQDLRDFCAQRPGRATPPCILDVGHVQLELGLADVTLDRDQARSASLAAPQLRLGLTRRLEAELGLSPWLIDKTRGAPRVTGPGDTSLGLMGAVTDPDADGAALAWQVFVNAPTARHGLGAGGWTGGLRAPAALRLTDSLSLAITPEVDVLRNADGGGSHLAVVGVGGLSETLGRLTVGAEVWAQIEDEPAGTQRRATADLTLAWMAGKTLQLDAGTAFGLNHATPRAEIYLGVSRRF